MNQPDIGWCPCCNRAVVEIPQGTCSNCFNHTMAVMSAYDHEESEKVLIEILKKTRVYLKEQHDFEGMSLWIKVVDTLRSLGKE